MNSLFGFTIDRKFLRTPAEVKGSSSESSSDEINSHKFDEASKGSVGPPPVNKTTEDIEFSNSIDEGLGTKIEMKKYKAPMAKAKTLGDVRAKTEEISERNDFEPSQTSGSLSSKSIELEKSEKQYLNSIFTDMLSSFDRTYTNMLG
jgi:hypothetical protein